MDRAVPNHSLDNVEGFDDVEAPFTSLFSLFDNRCFLIVKAPSKETTTDLIAGSSAVDHLEDILIDFHHGLQFLDKVNSFNRLV